MCGIIGIVGHPTSHVASSIYDGMLVLQHRGQDAAGIVTSDSNNITHRRANGLVRDVFTEKHMQKLTGSMGIGHVRYPTAGSNSADEANQLSKIFLQSLHINLYFIIQFILIIFNIYVL